MSVVSVMETSSARMCWSHLGTGYTWQTLPPTSQSGCRQTTQYVCNYLPFAVFLQHASCLRACTVSTHQAVLADFASLPASKPPSKSNNFCQRSCLAACEVSLGRRRVRHRSLICVTSTKHWQLVSLWRQPQAICRHTCCCCGWQALCVCAV